MNEFIIAIGLIFFVISIYEFLKYQKFSKEKYIFKNLLFLDKVKGITFLSLTNKTLDLHKNIISSGINSSSQLNTIKKFLETSEIKKTIFLIPNLDYDLEIKKGIKESKIKFFKQYNKKKI